MNDVISIVDEEYNIGKVVNISRIEHGRSNDNFLVETLKGKFVVKKYKIFHSLNRLNLQIEIHNFLLKNQISVPEFVLNKQNRILTKKKKTYYSITKFVENVEHDYKPNKEKITNCIKNQIYFHFIMKNFKSSKLSIKKDIFGSKNDITSFYSYNSHDDCPSVLDLIKAKKEKDTYDLWVLSHKDFLLSLIDETLAGIKKIEDTVTDNDYTIIHYDYSLPNISFEKGTNDIKLLLDFEFSHRDILQLDVVKSARFFAYDKGMITWNFFSDYIKEYSKLSGIKFYGKDVYHMLLFLVLRRVFYAWTYHYYFKDPVIHKLAEEDVKLVLNIIKNKEKIINGIENI